MKWLFAAAFTIALAATAQAQVQTNIGVLTCTLARDGDQGAAPPSQTRGMVCSFKPTGTGPEENYSGEIRKVGSDSALDGKHVLIWVVMGPADRKLTPGLLEQSYVGELAASPDGQPQKPKMLVGKTDEDFGLRPMEDQPDATATGSVTIVDLKVKSIAA
jgi:hypothetical protein